MSDAIHNDDKKFFDLRVVELSKSSRDNRLCEKLKAADKNSYVCFGHFDFLRISPLSGKEPLKCVEEDFKDRDNYNYPLYILHDPMEDPSALAGFWDTKSCFMTVSRIHFTPAAQKGMDCVREALEKLHRALPLRDKQLGELSIEVQEDLVHCVFYRTLELSDLVVVLKSNSILSCLEAMRRMMEVEAVGNVYSFCGVHGELCATQIEEAVKRWDATTSRSSFRKNAREAMEQNIPYASVRFAVIAARNALLFWSKTERKVHFISGTADAIINFSGATVKELVQYISVLSTWEWGHSVCMYDAFGDIITRIGISYNSIYDLALAVGPKEPVPALKAAQERLKNAVGELPNKQTRWFPILAAQTDSLITMMGNCITDNLSILIWPSVQALLDRLSYLSGQTSKINRKQEAEIGEFLNCWDILENDISRMEGELSQKPELLSSRYYIPATLLAFYMALLHKYNEFLLAANGEKDQSYTPLITYNVDPRASTHCILDPSTDCAAKVYQKATPLLVSLPVSMLYSPLETVIILCHEMSHYTGTYTRHRKARFRRILASCAELIAAEWKLDGRSDYPMSRENALKIIEDLRKKLEELYPQDAQYYIADLNANLYQIIIHVFYDEGFQSRLLQDNLEVKSKPRSILRYSKSFNASTRNQSLSNIRKHVRTLLILYKECYADLAAMMVLNLSAEEYLLNVFYREARYIKEIFPNEAEKRMWENQIQAALVLHTLDRGFTENTDTLSCTKEELEWLEEWKREIDRYRKAFSDPKKRDVLDYSQTDTAMYLGEWFHLLCYLKKCRETLDERLEKEEIQKKQTELIKMINIVKDNFDLESIQQVIADYQDTFLEASRF